MIVKTTVQTPTELLPVPHPRPETGRHRVTDTTPAEHRAKQYVPAWKAAQR